MTDPVIRIEQLGKSYLINHQTQRERYVALRDVLSGAVKGAARSILRRGSRGPSNETEEFWALKDLSFEVKRGDVVGIIGRNGAGKSTLLKILSRITEPTAGRVTIRGKVASLLEVGTGFHPELTGRENIYLNGAILGMARAEVRRKFDDIVAFADVERFLDTPVKRYSSGMYMRLAFAVAAFLESDILVVDEVLAVGDAAFQKKCLGRMGDVSASGRTVLFVSHNMGSLLSICHSGVLLDAGRLVTSGDIRSVAQAYQKLGETGSTSLARNAFAGPLKGVQFDRVQVNGQAVSGPMFVSPHEPLELSFFGVAERDVPNFRFGLTLLRDGTRVFTVHDGPEFLQAGPFQASLTVPALLLRPGDYMLSLGGRRLDGNDWTWGSDLALVTVMDEWDTGYDQDDHGVVNLRTRLERRSVSSVLSLPEVATARVGT
jgi:lipopolysaccharide transport system ATP-binding protein